MVSSFTTCAGELEMFLRGKNRLCDYLVDIVERDGAAESPYMTWTRVIWDVTAVAWLMKEDFLRDRLVPCPIPQYDHHYSFDQNRHFMRCVYWVNRDALFEDLFRRLSRI